ncbi:nucleotide pyrophosphohydrolase [Methanosarcina sp. DH1]|uniref:MazG nucleotide pyrophosphohydrolase domain-containing protein n=1 Tax=Methanosarcina sp. DH1 TaxID=2605695 RepID=UPI001E4D2083|nr:MazG nucleotide pyrophosphohydrolase domain-containing protein [Methanosarcina sp. DH1]MCC4765774.1 nucleotide pyrophosphohydrolase [Methanosarcina sp. DH1]
MEISEFQKLMSEMYAHNDRKRGGKATMLWLVEEIGELAEAIRREEPENIEEELADCFAWIGALANLYGVNLEEAFLKKYPGMCPTCKRKPCICTD